MIFREFLKSAEEIQYRAELMSFFWNAVDRKSLGGSELEIAVYISRHRECTAEKIAKERECATSTVNGYLRSLCEKGVIERLDKKMRGRGKKNYIYKIKIEKREIR